MKLLILIITIMLSLPAFAARRSGGVLINTPNGPVRYNNPFVKQKNDLKGVGMDFYGRAEIKDGVVSVWIGGCQRLVLGDINKEEDKQLKAKLEAVKPGQNLRLKMSGYGKCNVSDWE